VVSNSAFSQPRYLRVHIVAKRLGVSRRTVRHWAVTGQIPATRIGEKSWGVLEDDVRAASLRLPRRTHHRVSSGGRA
jgi:excisionase family DNA binding protein